MSDETVDKIKELTKAVQKQTEELVKKQTEELKERNRLQEERRKVEDEILANGGKVKIGEVGVDGGMLMVCDPCYIDNISNDEIDKLIFGEDEGSMEWKQHGQLNYSNGHAGLGVIFQSGFGDGMYDVIATFGRTDWGFRIKKVEIILIEEGEE